MNVLYEEDGGFKAAVILADNDTSLQVEAPHGKRSKIKASAIVLRFERPTAGEFMQLAQRAGQPGTPSPANSHTGSSQRSNSPNP